MQSLNKNEALQRLLKEENEKAELSDKRRDAALVIEQISSIMMYEDESPLSRLWQAITEAANAIWELNRYGF